MEIFGRMGYSKKDIKKQIAGRKGDEAPFQSAPGFRPGGTDWTERKRCKKVKK